MPGPEAGRRFQTLFIRTVTFDCSFDTILVELILVKERRRSAHHLRQLTFELRNLIPFPHQREVAAFSRRSFAWVWCSVCHEAAPSRLCTWILWVYSCGSNNVVRRSDESSVHYGK